MNEQPRIRVFSVDDHPLLREGIAAIINNQPDMTVIAQSANGQDAMQQFKLHQPDVTLMDLRLPDMSGIDALTNIRANFPRRASSYSPHLKATSRLNAHWKPARAATC